MLVLTETTDKISLITDVACDVDVVAVYSELNESTLVVGAVANQKTNITTATTTDIVAAPGGATTTRNIRELRIRNAHATTSVDVTIQFNANGTLYELHAERLYPGESLQWTLGDGFTPLKRRTRMSAWMLATDILGTSNIQETAAEAKNHRQLFKNFVIDTLTDSEVIAIGNFAFLLFLSAASTTGVLHGAFTAGITADGGSIVNDANLCSSITTATQGVTVGSPAVLMCRSSTGAVLIPNGTCPTGTRATGFMAGGAKGTVTVGQKRAIVNTGFAYASEIAGSLVTIEDGTWVEFFEQTK